ncbi:hypothetical protein MAC_07281 [Metarhizium acridum CQMa 102]|uniref:Uncharacterized protein n=1 Tax=Metarhizium acridum (strain CQMa 102) TaxID=655827 RepID=E9EBN3_METAQ|nr:uncharacterized protein MAC_07281 [Metarhizium acridum CQMa 102]EFY86683.1 hypothetical protein MAC_07281 [Metarhizium acridum CQMa 102]
MLAASLASIDIIRVEAGKTGLRYSSDITTLNKGDVVEFHFGTHAQCCRRRPQEALHPSCERVASAGFYADTSPAGNDCLSTHSVWRLSGLQRHYKRSGKFIDAFFDGLEACFHRVEIYFNRSGDCFHWIGDGSAESKASSAEETTAATESKSASITVLSNTPASNPPTSPTAGSSRQTPATDI